MRASSQFVLATLLALVVGCDSNEEKATDRSAQAEGPPQNQKAPPTATTKEAQIPLQPIGLVDQFLHQEPAMDEWQGEVFNDLASSQLKSLGKLLEHPETITATSLKNLAHAGFTPCSLLPGGLEVVFEDEAFLVKRPGPAGDDLANPKPLLEAVQELSRSVHGASGLRTEFKIFKVALEASGEPVSEAWFQVSGRTAQGNLAMRAKWRCHWDWRGPDTSPTLKSITVSEFEQTQGKGTPLFADATKAVFKDVSAFEAQLNRGIDHWAARLESRFGIGLSGWHGLAVGDANGDGLDDLYVCEPGALPNRLFIAKPDGTVIDASSLSGTDFRLQTQAALFLDLDNDGDQDLVLATTLGVIFMENDGRASFTVKSRVFVPEAPPVSLSAADFDLDGDLDVYVGCYSLRSASLENEQILGRPIPYHDANNGGRNVLLRNDRNWRFTNQTLKLGLDQNNRRFTLAASWEDYDDDGDPDLYVANDYGRNNLYRNDRDKNGDSTFTDVAKEAAVEDISAGMSVSWADVDGDGDRDLYVSNMWSSAGNRLAYQRNFQSDADGTARAEFQRHARGNSLFLNNGDGTFTDASLETGVTMGRWAWGSTFADLNNDGREDIFVANGFITQPDDNGDL
jgi:hypothetical protein